MTSSANAMEKRIRMAGIIVIMGLAIEALCLFWSRPISFVIFVAVGGLFLFVGVVVFLLSLVWAPRVPD